MIEIDILPASTDTKGADSILLRFGTFNHETTENNQKVILIDGGYKENAARIIEHLKKYYNSLFIDLLICTHPDADHINGLVELLQDENISINKALIHNPWDYKYLINRKSQDNRTTPNSIQTRLHDSLSSLDDLLKILKDKGVEVESPFAGHSELEGAIKVIGPSEKYYSNKVGEFPNMPNHKERGDDYDKEIVIYDEDMDHFLEDPETTARNSSSTIILFQYQGFKMLFTGDAGTEALLLAIQYTKVKNINLSSLNYMQIPHHGSLKNLSKDIADTLKASKYFVSAPSASEDHPSKLLLNYL